MNTIRKRTYALLSVVLVLAACVTIALVSGHETTSADAGFRLPWPAGRNYVVTRIPGDHGAGYNYWAYDFGLPEGSEVAVSNDGVVTAAVGGNTVGGCSSAYASKANYIYILHPDGSKTLYLHLKDVSVGSGQRVSRGQVIGHSGRTGWVCGSNGAHLHFQRDLRGTSTPIYFDEYPGQQLARGSRVTSQNGSTAPVGPLTASFTSPQDGQVACCSLTLTVRASGGVGGPVRFEFGALYSDAPGSTGAYWHRVGDGTPGNGWSVVWNVAGVPDQSGVVVHGWICDAAGNCNNNLPGVPNLVIRHGQPATTAIVDDPQLYGPVQYWLRYGIGNDGDMVATWNNGPCSYGPSVCPQGQDVNYAIWQPNLSAGSDYRVCAWIPQDHAYTHNAAYVVNHAYGTSVVGVNQQPIFGWANLGVFHFNAGTSGSVRLGDWTGEAFATMQIGFDAIKWVPSGGSC